MIFFAACAANQGDLVAEEARNAGSEDVRMTASGVHELLPQCTCCIETSHGSLHRRGYKKR